MKNELVDGRVVLDFRNGELVGILPIGRTDEEAAALLRQLEQAAAMGDLTQFTKE